MIKQNKKIGDPQPQTCKITLIFFIICFKISLCKQIFFYIYFCGSTKPAILCPETIF